MSLSRSAHFFSYNNYNERRLGSLLAGRGAHASWCAVLALPLHCAPLQLLAATQAEATGSEEQQTSREPAGSLQLQGGGIAPGGSQGEEISTNHLDVAAQQEDRDSCEVVHLSLVVSGHLAIRRTVVLVKSILFHRRNPIHLHLLTDARSGEILATIFKTWQLPAVNTSFYPLSAAIKAVEWIPTSHYSGVFGLSKLAFASALPASLRAVIALDTDVMLAADIGELWAFARRLRQAKKLLGLVENQSDWYLGNMWKGHKPWPAVGRGFNTGVAVLNLELMRTRDWNGTWHAAARDSLAVHTKAALADQDVVNAAIKRDNGDLVFILPCVWNVQLSENTLSDYCFKSAHHFKIIHWNSAAKLDVSNIYGLISRTCSLCLKTTTACCLGHICRTANYSVGPSKCRVSRGT